MALPPALSVSIAVWVAKGCDVAHIADAASMGDRPGK
jgi:hypothetical protein